MLYAVDRHMIEYAANDQNFNFFKNNYPHVVESEIQRAKENIEECKQIGALFVNDPNWKDFAANLAAEITLCYKFLSMYDKFKEVK